MTGDDLVEHKPETYAHLAIREREGLQRILRDHIGVLGMICCPSPRSSGTGKTRGAASTFSRWPAMAGVVIEPKRTESGGHLDLQAPRYAAMASVRHDRRPARRDLRGLPCAARDAERSEPDQGVPRRVS